MISHHRLLGRLLLLHRLSHCLLISLLLFGAGDKRAIYIKCEALDLYLILCAVECYRV